MKILDSIRKRIKKTQLEVANETKLNPSTVGRVLKGSGQISSLLKIMESEGLSIVHESVIASIKNKMNESYRLKEVSTNVLEKQYHNGIYDALKEVHEKLTENE